MANARRIRTVAHETKETHAMPTTGSVTRRVPEARSLLGLGRHTDGPTGWVCRGNAHPCPAADASARIVRSENERDADRLELLDRIADRVPELDLDRQSVEWSTLDDGHDALLVNGGGIDGGSGAYFANAGEDVHAVGKLDPLVPGHVGCIVIRPDGSRYLARAVPDPLALRMLLLTDIGPNSVRRIT
jgi:hypothetical protein